MSLNDAEVLSHIALTLKLLEQIIREQKEDLQKEVTFDWSPASEEAFQALKTFLTTAPMLAQPDIDRPFDVYYDASKMLLGV